MKICKDGRIWGQNNKEAQNHLGILKRKGYIPKSLEQNKRNRDTSRWDDIADTDLAYVAGIVDGEGFLGLTKDKQGGKQFFRFRLEVSNTSIVLIKWLSRKFGKKWLFRLAREKRHKNIYQWTLGDYSARKFLELILPYLKIKQEQAKLLMKYKEISVLNYPQVNCVEKEKIYWQLRKLNKRGR